MAETRLTPARDRARVTNPPIATREPVWLVDEVRQRRTTVRASAGLEHGWPRGQRWRIAFADARYFGAACDVFGDVAGLNSN